MSQSYKLMIEDEGAPITTHHSAQLRRQWRRAESAYKRQRRKIHKFVYVRSFQMVTPRAHLPMY
jgi:hypothetical protein